MERNVRFSEQSSPRLKRQTRGELVTAAGPLAGVNICVIGGGFVGLVTAAGFAHFGHSVVCVDKDSQRVKELQAGRVPFYEQELEGLIRRNLECNRLSFSGDLAEAVKGQKAIFVTVGTPASESGRTDLTALDEVAQVLSQSMEEDQVVVLKSTVPVGTGKRVRTILSQNGHMSKPIAVVNNPEFLREGSAVYDFFHPQRIVIGGDTPQAVELITHIYRLGMTRPVPIVITNNETAEMIKYASNAFLATKVGYVNELAGLCDLVGVNVLEVARAIGLDPRIGSEFLDPGPGWGGSCLQKDLTEFMGLAESRDYSLLITRAVLAANRRQHDLVVEKIKKLVGSLKDTQIGVLGLAFKADTSDMRDSPAIPIVNRLLDEGANVKAYDPRASHEAENYLPQIELVKSAYDVASDADCIAILTEWREFQLLDFKRISEMMRRPNLVDARNLLTPEFVQRCGLNYLSMGQA